MKLRAGIIGLGVGEAHIKGYQSHPDCEVAALCDFNDKKYRIFQKKYPSMMVCKDADDILKNPGIDVVSIASYDNYHYAQVAKAIRNRKHVFVEKPLCLHKKEALAIRALLKKNPVLKISSNLILRQCPRFRWLRDKIKKGGMGKIFHVEGNYNYGRLEKITQGWRGKIDFYSVVLGGGVHIVDLLLWLTGDRVVSVGAFGNRLASENTPFRYDDSVTAILNFKSGMTGKVSVHFGCMRPHFHDLAVYGTKATFINEPKHGLFYRSRDPKVAADKIDKPYPGVHKGDLICNFVKSIVDGSPAEVSREDIFKSMSVCFAIEKSVKEKRLVSVEYI